MMRFNAPLVIAAALLSLGLAFSPGCSSEGGGAKLPAALAARWSPPPFATRTLDAADVRAVTLACKQAALAGGFAVQRFNEAGGTLSAARRQTNAFDGARQDTLEVRVTAPTPGSVQVAVVLREVVESGAGDERSPGLVTSALVRDRAPYDAFFDRLTALLAVR
jgi:hypothetical protein